MWYFPREFRIWPWGRGGSLGRAGLICALLGAGGGFGCGETRLTLAMKPSPSSVRAKLAPYVKKKRPAIAWHKAKKPSRQKAESIGGYSRGCVAGAKALPLSGRYHVVMRPSRKRNFGHPKLISFIRRLAKSMGEHRLGRLAVGDLGQVRGGPALSGHKSHQSGLDVDLWFVTPKDLRKGGLLPPKKRLEAMGAVEIVDESAGKDRPEFNRRIDSMLRRAAQDKAVDRIFVHPLIKRTLCQRAGSSKAWLRKIRPWWGHKSHFHVRLHCPADSPDCEAQGALPAGDGCKELAWWFDKKAQEDRKAGRARYRKGMGKPKKMPPRCTDVWTAAAAAGSKP